MKNCVSINLRKNEILIKISDEAEQQEIMDNLRKKISELKKCIKMKRHQLKLQEKF